MQTATNTPGQGRVGAFSTSQHSLGNSLSCLFGNDKIATTIVYIRLILLVHLLGRPGELVFIRLIMLVHLFGRPGEFVYIRLIMLVHLLGHALWGPANLFTYV